MIYVAYPKEYEGQAQVSRIRVDAKNYADAQYKASIYFDCDPYEIVLEPQEERKTSFFSGFYTFLP